MMAKKATVSAEFIAVDKSLGAKIDQLIGRFDDLDKKVKDVSDKSSQNFAANMVQAADVVIRRLKQVGQELIQFAEQGTSFNLLAEGFDTLATSIGESSDELLSSLQKSSLGAINERNLMLSANRAVLLKVADTQEELDGLLAVATARANKLGLSATQAFNDIVTGLGRESAMILDNLGIIIKVEEVTRKYADTLGKTVAALTADERKQALVNAVLEDSKSLLSGQTTQAEQGAASVAKLSASWQNFTDHLSSSSAPLLADIAEKLSNIIEISDKLSQASFRLFDASVAKKELDDLKNYAANEVFTQDFSFLDNLASGGIQERIAGTLKEMGVESATTAEIVGYLTGRLNTLASQSNGTENAVAQLDSEIVAASNSLFSYSENTEQITRDNQLFEERMKLSSDAINYLAIATAQASSELGNFEARMLSLQRANASFEAGISGITNSIISQAVAAQKIVGQDVARNLANSALQQLNADTEMLKENLQSGEVSALDLALTFGQIEDQLLSPFEGIQEQNRLAQEAIKQTGKDTDKIARDAEQRFNQLQSKVASVLSSALDPGVGINPDDILPRTDAINEDARRLADIAVNGFKSPWIDYFKKDFPALYQQFFSGASSDEGVKLQAARLLKNFQDGLVPELIDKETAKERVRRALIGEQNMESLAREIATELAGEFGQSVSDVQSVANSVLGTGSQALQINAPTINPESTQQLSDQFQTGLVQSLDGFGERFATFLTGQLSAKVVLENVSSAGRQNGEVWGDNFLSIVGDNVPSQLVEILSLLVLPNVQKQLNQSDSREVAR